MRHFFLLLIFAPFILYAQQPRPEQQAALLLKTLSASGDIKADSACLLLNAAYHALSKTSGDSSKYYSAKLLTELAYYEYSLSNYDKSITDAMEALRLSDQLQQPLLIFNAAYRLGATYAKIGSNVSALNGELETAAYRKKARAYFAQSAAAAEQLGDSSRVISAQIGVINTFLSGKQKDSVMFFSTALLKRTVAGMHKERSQLYNLAGIAAYESGDFTRAGGFFSNAISEARQVPGSLTLNSTLGNLANVYMEQGRFAEARILLYELIVSNLTKKRKQALSKNYITLHNLYKRQTVYDSALFYLEKYYLYRDSVLGEEHKLQIEDLELKYESEKKERRINELTLSNALKSARLRQQNLWLILLIGSGLAIPVMVFLFYRQRSLRQKQANAEIRQQLLTAQMNPHFLFNALNSIQRLYVDGRIDEGNLFMSEFAQFVRDILDKTGRLKIPVQEEVDFLQAYLSLEKKRLGDVFDFSIEPDESLQQSLAEVPSLIAQPLAENALLHGILPGQTKGYIHIAIQPGKKDSVVFKITDNGIGYEESIKRRRFSGHTSKGTELILARLGSGGRLSFTTLKDEAGKILGTEATLIVNI